MQKGIRFLIPEGWRFSNLHLHRNTETGDVSVEHFGAEDSTIENMIAEIRDEAS